MYRVPGAEKCVFYSSKISINDHSHIVEHELAFKNQLENTKIYDFFFVKTHLKL